MASFAGTPIKGKIVRVIQLDLCGIPITGAAGRVVITNSFTKVDAAPQWEEGTEFFERTADGTVCVNQKDNPILKRFQLSVDLCSVDPDMTPLVLAARELTTTGPVSGTGFAMGEGASNTHFSLEVWQQIAGSNACNAAGQQQYIYNAWPHLTNTKLQGYTVENAKTVLSFMADSVAAAPQWGHGAGSGADAAKWLPVGAGGNTTNTDHWLWNITAVAPPVAAVGFTLLV